MNTLQSDEEKSHRKIDGILDGLPAEAPPVIHDFVDGPLRGFVVAMDAARHREDPPTEVLTAVAKLVASILVDTAANFVAHNDPMTAKVTIQELLASTAVEINSTLYDTFAAGTGHA